MCRVKPSASAKPDPSTARADLIAALAEAVQAEARFGARFECRADLERRWSKVVDAIKAFCG